MYLLVDLISKESFIRKLGVGELGAGHVVRNTVPSIMTLRQVKSSLQQKIIMPIAVKARKDSKKKTIVLEDILDIVNDGGELF
jgi:hypothetical protein